MINILEMGTTFRHNRLLATLYSRIDNWLNDNKSILTLEQIALCYLGKYQETDFAELLTGLEETSLNLYNVVYPDLMLFKNNPYIANKELTRFAGRPDLIIEVWSDANTQKEMMFKKSLYSTSSITEHWYLTQTSNIIECWIGKKRINDKNLNDILYTKTGIEIDIRHLSL